MPLTTNRVIAEIRPRGAYAMIRELICPDRTDNDDADADERRKRGGKCGEHGARTTHVHI